ncbi:hypothetical protein K501DRAFT_329772 [Backusella circina FSU 941]|nr:hypothetical protein K501DRAFT_329772 [Backusella circina FSU 941]
MIKAQLHLVKDFKDQTCQSSSCTRDSNDEEKQIPFRCSKPHFLYTKFSDKTVRRVLKCTIAYFISTLFSLYRPLADKLGPAPFLISTGHPGRTLGAQLDTTLTGTVGILFAMIYPLISIAVATEYRNASFGSIIGCRIIHSLFLFNGIFFAQYLRQTFPKLHYFSLQFMIIQIFVITRDLNYQSIPFELPLDYGLSLLIGHIISLTVNILIWPEAAVDGFGKVLKETVICSKDMLHTVMQRFFLDSNTDSSSENDTPFISSKISSKISQLNTIYRDAKYEVSYAFIRPQQLDKVRKSLNRLTKHLNLLANCLETKDELFESAMKALEKEDLNTGHHDYDIQLLCNSMRASQDYLNGEYTLDKYIRNNSSSSLGSVATMVQDLEEEDLSTEKASVYSNKSHIFLSSFAFSKQLPSLKPKKETEYDQRHLLLTYLECLKNPLVDLSLTCSNTLDCICHSIIINFDIRSKENYTMSETFTEKHKESQNCNCSQIMRLAIVEFDRAEREQMHALYHINKKRLEESLDFGLRQELFLVFFFINTMRELANELKQMSFELDLIRFQSISLLRHTPNRLPLTEEIKLMNRLPKRTKNKKTSVNSIKPSSENQADHVPWLSRIRFELWLKLRFFNNHKFKFSIKMATAVLVLCLPAFFTSSKTWYSNYKGQWAALTVISIMNPTSGGTFDASFWRIIGTVTGALVGWVALEAGNGSPYFLALFAIFLVVALGRYVSPVPGESISTTVWKRSLTLIIGIFVALVLNSAIWPYSAQRMVRKTVAGCIEQLENHYLYINSHFLYQDPNIVLDDTKNAEKIENKIQSTIHACSTFLELTDHELCFQRPFPKAFYKEIITSMQKLLDHMQSIRIVLLEMPIVVKNDICEKEYHVDRKEMISAIILSFHTLASSLRSKTALPVYIPSARTVRNKLMDHRRSNVQMTHWVKFRNLTWFSMAYSTQEIISELEYLFDLVQVIVGENASVIHAQHIENCKIIEDDKLESEGREELVKHVLELQTQLKAMLARVDGARAEHQSLVTENQLLQKYINNSLTSTAVFGATHGAINSNNINLRQSSADSPR